MLHIRSIARKSLRHFSTVVAVRSRNLNVLHYTKKALPFGPQFKAPNASLWVATLAIAHPSDSPVCFAEDYACSTSETPRVEVRSTVEENGESDTEDEIEGREERRGYKLKNIRDVRIFREDAAPGAKAFGHSLIGSYVSVYAASTIGRYLESAPVPNQSITEFLRRNFLLTTAHVRSGRWHVLITYMFSHKNLGHLLANSLTTLLGIGFASSLLNVWEIAALYFGGGIISGAASILLSRYLLAARYRGQSMGCSGGIFALLVFYWCAEIWGSRVSQLDLFDILFIGVIAREVCGVGIYLRHGFKGKGIWSLKQNHVIHLTGAATGFAAYVASKPDREATEQSRTVLTPSSV